MNQDIELLIAQFQQEGFRGIADRISALEQNAKCLWREGDFETLDLLKEHLTILHTAARNIGATEETHPGLFEVTPLLQISEKPSFEWKNEVCLL